MLKIKLLIRKYQFEAVDLIESGLKEYFSEYDSKYSPDYQIFVTIIMVLIIYFSLE